jgi:hypothetical protein
MAARKTSTARKSKAAVAKAEKKAPTERSFEWEGLTITLPLTPQWDDMLAELALVNKSDSAVVGMEMLIEMIGPDQYKEAIKVLKANGRNRVEGLGELSGRVFEEYGTSEGESEASQDS